MRNVFLVIALTMTLFSAYGGVVYLSNDIDADTAQVISNTITQANGKYPSLAISTKAAPTLLAKTYQNPTDERTYLFKYATGNGSEQVYHVTVIAAYNSGRGRKVTKVSVARVTGGCANTNACKMAALYSSYSFDY
mmetsp:Transcript_14046/g.16188  ORF Transcript_14046/g.16188 Transcript_14046/m.16188 type:complete len:136 (+) Transcript_14046:25-432(+)